MTGRLTLALYNTYDAGRWHDAMRVALARAGPVAAAFDCNLVTFGFPYDEGRRREGKKLVETEEPMRTPQEVAQFVAQGTSIGDGGEYFIRLANEGRFSFHPFPRTPTGWPPQYGLPVVTTPDPDPRKAVTPLSVAEELVRGQSQMLVFGLGPRGLPKDVLAENRVHLELTGRNISMETATALGALPAIIATHLQHLGPTAPRQTPPVRGVS